MLCSALSEHKLSGKTKPESQHETENIFQNAAINTRKPHVIAKMQIFGQPVWTDSQKANTDVPGILRRNKSRKPRSSQISHLKKCNQPLVFLFFFNYLFMACEVTKKPLSHIWTQAELRKPVLIWFFSEICRLPPTQLVSVCSQYEICFYFC